MTLAHSFQRRHGVSPDSPSTSPYLSQAFFDIDIDIDTENLDHSAYSPVTVPAPLDLSHPHPSSDPDFYFNSRQSTPYEQTSLNDPSSSDTQFMTDSSAQNPRLRVQQSTPNTSPYSPPPMSAGSYQPQSWNNLQDWSHLSPHAQQQQYSQPAFRSHKRLPSESSVGSAGPASPYTQSAAYPHIVDTETQSVNSPHFESFDNSYSNAAHFAKPLPAYTSPLNNGSLFHQAYNFQQPSTNNAGQYIQQQSAMRQAMRGQRGNSMSGGHNLPTETSYGGTEYDGSVVSADLRRTPNLDRTMSDIYQDELYNPSMAQPPPSTQPSHSQQSQVNLLSPSYRATFNNRLQEANAARSASPTNSLARERSPFREYAVQEFAQGPNSPVRMNSARQIRAAQKLQADAQAYTDHHPQISSHDFASPNTISPKEVSLDYHQSEDESKNFPLFPQQQLKQENGFASVNNQRASTTQSHNDQYARAAGLTTYPSSTSDQSNSNFTFMPPSVPGVPQAYPFISQRRQSNSMRSHNSDQVPEFPATLSSMESTKSDSGASENVRPPGIASQHSSEPSSQEQTSSSPLPRPQDTSANSGTYTCTAPSCTARFDTSIKLQKHRREAHTVRTSASPYAGSASPATPSSNMTDAQAAANNVNRNNQPGPHKCDKINPSTGKPCNTIFSRSYDLTRHEDTIHNNRKHKVRCHLCTEEKTFSRNDALTRHMRVVHPEVEQAGKSRRGGRS